MKKILIIILNLGIGFMSFAAWIGMALIHDGSMLSSQGLISLKYFTVLSNLMNGFICLYYAGWLMLGRKIDYRRQILKLTGTTAVGLTFTTVMVFLGPLYGYSSMFTGSNFWMHLVLPVASMLSFMLLELDCRISPRAAWYAVIPMILYAIGYLVNIGLHGIGTWPNTNDFYGFFHWGYQIGAVIAIVILLGTWMIALLLCAVANFRNRISRNK